MLNEQELNEMLQGKRPAYVFKTAGEVMAMSEHGRTGMLVAVNRQSAEAWKTSLDESGKKISVYRVGSGPNDSLLQMFNHTMAEQGANGLFILDGDRIDFCEAR